MRWFRSARSSVAVCSSLMAWVVLAPSSAFAQQTEERPAHEAEARASFERGRDAFAAADYEEALARFREAYALSERAQLLFNIGSSAERLARDDEALEAYRAFVEALPEHESVPEAQRRITVLEARIRSRPVSSTTTVTEAAAPARVQVGGWLWSWVALGATALAGGAAGLSWALANDAYAGLEASCYPRGCSEQEIASSEVQARLDATTAMLVVTGVFAAATVVLFVLEAPHEEDAPALALELGPARLGVRGSF